MISIGILRFDSSLGMRLRYRNKLTLAVSKFSIRKMETLLGNGGISQFRNNVRVSPDKKFARAFWKIHQFFKVLSDVCTSEAEMYITIIFQTFWKRGTKVFIFLSLFALLFLKIMYLYQNFMILRIIFVC